MSRAVQARLSRLEAAAPQPGRVVAMFAWGITEAEIEAEQADMVRRGLAPARGCLPGFHVDRGH